jgi:1-deoxy-D-xylulose-5-phosphate reductoisomerase
MTRSIALLGSTGSIGRQTLEVARELGLSVAALTANKSVDLIEQQAREFCPRLAVLYDEDAANELRARLSDTNTQVLSGMEGLLAAATAALGAVLVVPAYLYSYFIYKSGGED